MDKAIRGKVSKARRIVRLIDTALSLVETDKEFDLHEARET